MADALSTRHIKYNLLITVDYRSKNNEKTLNRKCMASYICVLGNDITGQFALIFLVMNRISLVILTLKWKRLKSASGMSGMKSSDLPNPGDIPKRTP